jgi:hypothetical protein
MINYSTGKLRKNQRSDLFIAIQGFKIKKTAHKAVLKAKN